MISLNLQRPIFFTVKSPREEKLAKCTGVFAGCQLPSIQTHCRTDLLLYYRQAGACSALLKQKGSGQMHIRAIAVWLMAEAGNLGSWSEDKVGGVSLLKAGVGRCSKANFTHPACNESFLVLSYSRVLERSVLVAPCLPSSPSSPRCAFLGHFFFFLFFWNFPSFTF